MSYASSSCSVRPTNESSHCMSLFGSEKPFCSLFLIWYEERDRVYRHDDDKSKQQDHTFVISSETMQAINMSLDQLVPTSWLIHVLTCYFGFRHIRNDFVRAVLTLGPCVILTYLGCRDLPSLSMSSVVVISTYWMLSIRLIQTVIFYPDESQTLLSFLLKLFWNLFPIIRSDAREKQLPIMVDLAIGYGKLILNHWIIRWLIHCPPSDNYARSMMAAFMVLTSSCMGDITSGFVRLFTRDKYSLLSINYYPLFSKSLREFWGRRYNRLTSTVFNESLFKPIKTKLSSAIVASFITFIVSGLLHAHIAWILFHDVPSVLSTFAFFLLHAILCSIEPPLLGQLPTPLKWLITHLILFLTLPLATGPSTRQGPAFFLASPPPLFDAPWLPRLPIPNTCLA